MTRHDVAIVGARAAGSATALLLARLGHDVVLLDRAIFPSDTVSTHQIARTGVVHLHRWGLLDQVLRSGAPAVRRITFHTGGESVTRQVKRSAGVDHLVAPRRYVLDDLLANAAGRAGARLRAGVSVTGVHLDDHGRATGVYGNDRSGTPVSVDARYVVGADGLTSRVARHVGAPLVQQRPATGATQYAYFAGLPWDGIEFFVADGALAGIFPTHHGEACVWVCAPTATVRAARRGAPTREESFARLLRDAAPALSDRLRQAERTSPVAGMLRAPNQVRQAAGPGWALVGDAGYHRDPVTGHGLSDAFRDAELLAVALDRALRGGDDRAALAAYRAERDRALREVFDLTCALAAFPPVPEFVRLQKQLARAIEQESLDSAARPLPGGPTHPDGAHPDGAHPDGAHRAGDHDDGANRAAAQPAGRSHPVRVHPHATTHPQTRRA
jgi:2-polyprenyl-6-methoxyphenol hydroxylase-like FAD-dependent oxidoreductase